MRHMNLSLLILCPLLVVSSILQADVLWECPKTFTMSSKVGVVSKFSGTDYIKYKEGMYICDLQDPQGDECYFRYRNTMEGDGAVVGFHRQKKYPKDTQVIVLDLRNSRFYKTIEQGDLRLTIFGECQNFGENRLTIRHSRKDDAIALMGFGLFVSGVAAYCTKYVGDSPTLVAAAVDWNDRHDVYMKKIIHVIESEGGMTEEQKDTIDKFTSLRIRMEIKRSGDGPRYCNEIAGIVRSGLMDLDKHEKTKSALSRLMSQ